MTENTELLRIWINKRNYLIKMKTEWTKAQIELHEKAAKLLDEIVGGAFDFIKERKNVSEYDVQQFIVKEFEKNNLIGDKDPPIVAFDESAAEPHYFAKEKESRILGERGMVLIDVWAKLDIEKAPYADITWIGHKGEIDKKVQKVFDVVLEARDKCIEFIKRELAKGKMPNGGECDEVVRKVIDENSYLDKFLHGTGHSLADNDVHGYYPYLNFKSFGLELLKNVGYTIEPGIYLKGEFGVRSEIGFYIDDGMEFVLTSPLQKKIVKV